MKSSTLRRNTLTLCLTAALPSFGCYSTDDTGSADTEAGTGGETVDSGSSATTSDPTSASSSSTSMGTSDGSTTSSSDDTGDGTTGGPSDTSDTSADSTGAVEGPQVLETIPADGATGVWADAQIVIVFSEPMDKAATQAAYQSADIPAAAVTFSWNDTGDELTITPTEELDYALVDEVADPAQSYAFTITTAAESESGVPIDADIDVEFTTLRLFLQTVTADSNLTGAVRDLAGPIAGPNLGDTSTNDPSRFFITFDLAGMAPEVAELQAVEMTVNRNSQVSGNPFSDLGGVVYQQVQFDALDASTFDAAGLGMAGAMFPTSQGLEQTVDASTAMGVVLDDPNTYDGLLQFRLVWFPNETDGDGSYDSITINAGSNAPELGMLYLAP